MADTLYLQLLKLSAINSEETLDQVLTILWKTRKSGLRSPEKSDIQSLLGLPSVAEVDPVLACLRSLIRKCVRENCTADDLLKLFPPELSIDLQNILVQVIQKYQSQWKEEVSREQQPFPRSTPPSFTPWLSSSTSTSIQPYEDDTVACNDPNNFGASALMVADDPAGSCMALMSVQPDLDPPDNLAIIPLLKSMTWTMENLNSEPANKVAIIHLKLEDCSKLPAGEKEVKFRLTNDMLEVMLNSLAYISEKLSSRAETSSEPVQKKQRQ
ncbi:hypothetical protein SLEP1_g54164 [Rubroshorea leprosula]|uniref:COMM domain-containing protein n=1 Tax=Rubroshorea leprosula TaxID=152421 RepID=A0AAV5MEH5_9ROSI|nr:hypothetical protein SLEP1_g54164 [Rubroshorea leprosula]